MCGIAGYVTTRPNLYGEAVLRRMTDVIAHRGPDGFGYFRDSHAALGHRRLSIIDLAGGAQPMYNEDQSLVITYNGEIFNHSGEREPLERAGHRYHSRSDTEMVLHAYEEYGPESLEHYRGMFAFAMWDQNRRELFCARDRLGIKPFYYYWDGTLFAFASEIKALLEHPSISTSLDESGMAEYLAFGYRSDERTLFSGIRQLMPGHWLRLRLNAPHPEPEIRQYWDAPHGLPVESVDEPECIRDCTRRLEETVSMRLMSDVPLGMFLSGGVDSSAIAAIIKRMGRELNTFAVGYSEAAFSELSYASNVARHIGARHHEVLVSETDFFDALPRLIWHEDEPITWPSSVSLYFVSKLASSEVKVVLTGEGSDELFGGYARYRHYLRDHRAADLYRHVPGAARKWLAGSIANNSLLSGNLRRKLQHTIFGRDLSIESLYLDNYYCVFPEGSEVLSHALAGSPYDGYLRYREAAARSSALQQLLYADQKTYLVELLRKQDRMSMACSIESRVPFLDHTFVEFAGRVPDNLKIHDKTTKYILKRAVEDLLPPSIIHRRKMGFPTPLTQWLSGPGLARVSATLREPDGVLAGFIDRNALDRMLNAHQRGGEDATDRIWRLLNIQMWGDIFLKGRREAPSEGLLSSAS